MLLISGFHMAAVVLEEAGGHGDGCGDKDGDENETETETEICSVTRVKRK